MEKNNLHFDNDNINEQEIINKVVKYYHQTLQNSPEVLDFISKEYSLSGEELEKFQIGYSDSSLLNVVSKNSEIWNKLKKLNFFVKEKDYFREFITFPVIDENNIIQDIIGYNTKVRKNRKQMIRYLTPEPYITIDEDSILAIIKRLVELRIKSPSMTKEISKEKVEGEQNKSKEVKLEDDLFFQYGVRTYRVRGLNAFNFNKLKINLQITQDDLKFTDTLDLYIARTRISLVNRISEMFDIEYEDIEKEINQLSEQLDEIRLNIKNKQDKKPVIPVIKKEEKKSIIDLLKKENLVEMIRDDLTKIGIAGEDKNKTMLYMVYTSRKLKKPMSVVVKGDSAGGKSYLASQVLKLFPDEDIKNFTEVSAKSLFYMGEDELTHKILIIFERQGSRASDYSIRSLQSEDKLQLAVTVRDPKTGDFKTLEKTVKGPVSYVETSTQLSIHPENETRMFDLYIDESAEQTKKIYRIQNLEYLPENRYSGEETNKIISKHHLIQRILEPVKVKIPYVELIEFPVNKLRLRRDRMRFLALIESFAFLYQYQRDQDTIKNEKYTIADIEDYKMAYELAEDIMVETLSVLHQKSRDLLEEIKALDKKSFCVSNIIEKTGWTSLKVRRYMKQLIEEEYIEQQTGGQGKRGVYNLCNRKRIDKEKLEGLLSPENLKNKLVHLFKGNDEQVKAGKIA